MADDDDEAWWKIVKVWKIMPMQCYWAIPRRGRQHAWHAYKQMKQIGMEGARW
jgi:hypothetical protein